VIIARFRRFLGLPQQVFVPRDLSKVEQGVASSLAGVMAAAAISLSPISGLLGFGRPNAANPARPNNAVAEEIWLSESSMARASAMYRKSIPSAPRATNLLGESPLVRRAEAAGKMKPGKSKGHGAEDAPAVNVALPNGEGEVQGDGSVEVEVPPPTLDPGDDNPLCDPTQPGCTPTNPSGSAEVSARVRVRDVEVEVSVSTEDVANAVAGATNL
jgi:hypothetical protein